MISWQHRPLVSEEPCFAIMITVCLTVGCLIGVLEGRGVFSKRLLWLLCKVGPECDVPHFNTDIYMVVFLITFFPSMLYRSYWYFILGKKAYNKKAWTWQISAWNNSPIISMWNVIYFDSSKGIHQQCACTNSPIEKKKRKKWMQEERNLKCF